MAPLLIGEDRQRRLAWLAELHWSSMSTKRRGEQERQEGRREAERACEQAHLSEVAVVGLVSRASAATPSY
ncbi:MAG: hypothetical protein CMJ88_09100 [Planctomycetes bacterium]|nr:hypothetical protein [Planctomycetota bacterium]